MLDATRRFETPSTAVIFGRRCSKQAVRSFAILLSRGNRQLTAHQEEIDPRKQSARWVSLGPIPVSELAMAEEVFEHLK
jgi:hypothetical protein